MNRVFSLASAVVMIGALNLVGEEVKVVPLGETIPSPNKEFSVRLMKVNRDYVYEISRETVGNVSHIVTDYWPLFSLNWSPDSKNIVSVAHASETSLIEFLHWDGQRWKLHIVDAPGGGDNCRFHVLSWRFESGHIEAIYLVDQQLRMGINDGLYKCLFKVNLVNGKAFGIRKAPITLRQMGILMRGVP
ncbi:MAG: hypothetical protein M3Y27_11325 [Acidobacteriota bacterium]|nr:hypothetical protein [Acidobacteriota bacterium]